MQAWHADNDPFASLSLLSLSCIDVTMIVEHCTKILHVCCRDGMGQLDSICSSFILPAVTPGDDAELVCRKSATQSALQAISYELQLPIDIGQTWPGQEQPTLVSLTRPQYGRWSHKTLKLIFLCRCQHYLLGWQV